MTFGRCPDCGTHYSSEDGTIPEHTEGLCPAGGTWEPAFEGKPLEFHPPRRDSHDPTNCEGSGELPAAIRTRKPDGRHEPDIHSHFCQVVYEAIRKIDEKRPGMCGWWAHEGERCRSKVSDMQVMLCPKHAEWTPASSGQWKPPDEASPK